ncbi:MAG: methionine ABC transporter substrate-binding protein [Propionibacteriaceae bacterium]|jgi:D-methionine transport system substrate-binding protein|nr:methionine ABC transporter substrate-binding protein [Propionibacteriaceae bacterium]
MLKSIASRARRLVLLPAVALSLTLTGGLTACSGDDDAKPIKIGVVGASDPYWAVYVQTAKDAGIDIELVDFTDYALPNPALSEGELDINQFQHIVYLGDYIAKSGKDLIPLGSTAIYPLSLFSKQYDKVDDIPDGAQVVVPDDPSNQARGLLLLQSAGLIELKGGGTIFSSLADIDPASRVKVTTVAADLTPTALEDAAAVIINNDYVNGAGLKFEDAIAKDDPADASALPYVNIFAVRPEDKDNQTYLKLVELFQDTQAVTDGLQENSGGVAEIVKIPQADLQAALDKVVSDTLDQG